MKEQINVGIVGVGVYLPSAAMSAKEISQATNGVWNEQAVIEKLGIVKKYLPNVDDGTQEMGARAALNCLENTKVNPLDIDVILCIGEEWREFPLTTSACYIQDRIGAKNAWGIDLQNRCCTCVSAMKIAADMLRADESINTILIRGGYRNGDFVDYTDKNMSMMYNLSAGGGAIILKKNYGKNLLLGSKIISDGSLARTSGVEIGGTGHPFNHENVDGGYKTLRLFEPVKMKERLNEVSMPNWYKCIDDSLAQAGLTRKDIGYLDVLHMKRSGHNSMLAELGLSPEQTVYLEDYGHVGQIDQILSLKLGIEQGKVVDGTVVCMIAAGIGYVWSANVIRWGTGKD